ncbi:unnamed protein product [Brassica rapa]|uniref:Uncharacterized protein n=1 Tax=Brassica campestris TaxID=3711 RepID=A0A8D9H4S7_BRACM|nr:unnamed protein product [Brassica rapa]
MKQTLAKPIQLSDQQECAELKAKTEKLAGILCQHIALLQTGSLENRSDAAASLISLTRDNDRYTKLIIVQRGIGPLLTAGEQVSAAAHFTYFFTRPKQVKRIEISDQHCLATQKKDLYDL